MAGTIDNRAFLIGLHEALGGMTELAEEADKELAERILEAAKAKVHVDSGDTRDSLEVIEVRDDEGHRAFEVGTSLEKAIYEEFGTSKMQAIPFMRPAIAQET